MDLWQEFRARAAELLPELLRPCAVSLLRSDAVRHDMPPVLLTCKDEALLDVYCEQLQLAWYGRCLAPQDAHADGDGCQSCATHVVWQTTPDNQDRCLRSLLDMASSATVLQGRHQVLVRDVHLWKPGAQAKAQMLLDGTAAQCAYVLTARAPSALSPAVRSRCAAVNCAPARGRLRGVLLRLRPAAPAALVEAVLADARCTGVAPAALLLSAALCAEPQAIPRDSLRDYLAALVQRLSEPDLTVAQVQGAVRQCAKALAAARLEFPLVARALLGCLPERVQRDAARLAAASDAQLAWTQRNSFVGMEHLLWRVFLLLQQQQSHPAAEGPLPPVQQPMPARECPRRCGTG